MRIRIFRATSLADAMAQVRDELGLDALILGTETRAGLVEVTAALETEDESEPAATFRSARPILRCRICRLPCFHYRRHKGRCSGTTCRLPCFRRCRTDRWKPRAAGCSVSAGCRSTRMARRSC